MSRVALGWQPTAALVRALVLGVGGAGYGAATGEPALLVLAAPLLVHAVIASTLRPRTAPRGRLSLDHGSLAEGQASAVRLVLEDDADVEQVTRVTPPEPYVRVTPARGRIVTTHRPGAPAARPRDGLDVVVSPRRWGIRTVGAERYALTSRWGGFRWGPVPWFGHDVRVLPTPPPLGTRTEQPHPHGLLGSHRGARPGSGTELAGIRPFQPGDRLRRIHWAVSARTGALHVTTTRAEQDAGLLLVVDLLAEHGDSGGIDGAPSSLDVTVRAAAALAELAVRRGDRIGLRSIGGRARQVPAGTGRRHLRRLLTGLAEVSVGDVAGEAVPLELRVGAGTTVVVLSPLLTEAVATTAATLTRRGVPTVVIDTLPVGMVPDLGDRDPAIVDVAWRMRLLEREQVTRSLDALGCPVVTWRGGDTIDDLFRGLLRRARAPRVVRR